MRLKPIDFLTIAFVATLLSVLFAHLGEANKVDVNAGRLSGTLVSKTVTTFPDMTARVDLMVRSGGLTVPVFCGSSLAPVCSRGAANHPIDVTTTLRPSGESRVASIVQIVLEE